MKLPPGRGETILIVDDDDLVRPSAVSLIESLGYRVLSARTATMHWKSCVKILGSICYSLIFSCPAECMGLNS